MDFKTILKDLKNKIYKPVYFLTGEEEYYIDIISEYIIDNVLTESEKSFNQTIVYGKDSKVKDIINYCKRYPMMANNQVVILREAQELKDIEKLLHYVENPLSSTIFVINYKYKKYDSRKKLFKAANKTGVTLTANKLYDNQVQPWIEKIVSKLNMKIDAKSTALLAEYLGNNLSKIKKELEKLKTSLEGESDTITVESIEKYIGISKDYNVFELNSALGKKDFLKIHKISLYFGSNSKGFNHPIPVIARIFDFYKKLFTYHLTQDKSTKNIASILGISPFHLKDYQIAAKHYNPRKIVQIFSLLREYDMKIKGVGASIKPKDLYKELFFKITH